MGLNRLILLRVRDEAGVAEVDVEGKWWVDVLADADGEMAGEAGLDHSSAVS